MARRVAWDAGGQPRDKVIRHDAAMDLKTKLLIALVVLVAVAGLSLSFLISFTATPAG